MRSLSWQQLNDTINNRIHTINIYGSSKTFTISPELKTSVLNSNIDNLILLYDIESNFDQYVYISHWGANGSSFSSEGSSIDIKFNYKCAILDLKNDKVIMYVKMENNSSSPLNFFDEVCEKLFDVLFYDNAK